MKKFIYVRRNDEKHHGSVVEIPADHLEMTLRVHKTWEVIEETQEMPETTTGIEGAPQTTPFECPLCGYTAKSIKALRMHKIRKHP